MRYPCLSFSRKLCEGLLGLIRLGQERKWHHSPFIANCFLHHYFVHGFLLKDKKRKKKDKKNRFLLKDKEKKYATSVCYLVGNYA